MEQSPATYANDQSKKKWEAFSKVYSNITSVNYEGLGIELSQMVGCQDAGVIFEMGCGDGNIGLNIMMGMKRGCRLVCSDISSNMLKMFSRRIDLVGQHAKEHGIVGIRKVMSTQVDPETVEWNPAESCKRWEEFNIELHEADNEDVRKIFPDGDLVDCVIANLSIHIVGSPKNMLKEIFRVLKKGGKMAVTTWGSQANSEFYTLDAKLIEKFGLAEKYPQNNRTLFYLNDRKTLIEMMRDVGFTDILVWETFVPYALPQDTLNTWFNYMATALSDNDATLQKQMYNYLQDDHDVRTREKMVPFGLNVLVFTGSKS